MFYLICLICPNWYQPVSKIHLLIVGFVLKKEKAACQTAVYLMFSIIKRNRRLRSSAITSSLDPPLASEMFPSAQSVTEMSKNSCKSENCKQKKELPVTAVTCDRSVKCERVWISSVPERPEVPVQTDSPGAPCGEEEDQWWSSTIHVRVVSGLWHVSSEGLMRGVTLWHAGCQSQIRTLHIEYLALFEPH